MVLVSRTNICILTIAAIPEINESQLMVGETVLLLLQLQTIKLPKKEN